MKKVFFIVAMALMMATGCNRQKQEQEQQNMDKENNELTAFDVQKAFEKNGFSWFTENLLVCSGDTTQNNAMTIGWGGIGNYLGHNRPAVTVYVAPGRYSWEFMAAVFSQHNNADLLYKAYISGEMPLLNYLLETDYYLSAYVKQLQAQRDLELTLSELNGFRL